LGVGFTIAHQYRQQLPAAQSTADANYLVNGFNKTLLVALSTADTNKWSTLLKRSLYDPMTALTNTHDERLGPIRQRQRRLSDVQVHQMTSRYQEGATVYELAKEFDICRSKVSDRMKKAGVTMRFQTPSIENVTKMIELYQNGLSLQKVAIQLKVSAHTVRKYVIQSGVAMRDSHGRMQGNIHSS
jgi:transposase-like protein